MRTAATLIILFAALAVQAFVFSPLYKEAKTLRAEFIRKSETAGNYDLSALWAEYTSSPQIQQIVSRAVPLKEDADSVAEVISSYAEANHLVVNKIRTEAQINSSQIQLTVDLNGGIANFVNFLKDLESHSQLMQVNSVNFSKTRGFNIKLSAFYTPQ